jgi:hypothetical protein
MRFRPLIKVAGAKAGGAICRRWQQRPRQKLLQGGSDGSLLVSNGHAGLFSELDESRRASSQAI